MARYLITRLSALGDVAMLLQVLYAVAEANEQHEFVLLTQPFMTFVQADVTALPFDDESFDAVTMSSRCGPTSVTPRSISSARRSAKPRRSASFRSLILLSSHVMKERFNVSSPM